MIFYLDIIILNIYTKLLTYLPFTFYLLWALKKNIAYLNRCLQF